MHHLHVLTPQTPISPSIHSSLINNYTPKIKLFSSSPVFHNNGCYRIIIKRPPLLAARQRSSSKNIGRWVVFAVERESKFQVDQDKARQALDELDQQLESLSNKQITPPKIRASSLSTLKDEMKEEATSEISGSFLAVLAFGLFAFSIFYNILFLTVIKPSIDGPDNIIATDVNSTEVVREILQN